MHVCVWRYRWKKEETDAFSNTENVLELLNHYSLNILWVNDLKTGQIRIICFEDVASSKTGLGFYCEASSSQLYEHQACQHLQQGGSM